VCADKTKFLMRRPPSPRPPPPPPQPNWFNHHHHPSPQPLACLVSAGCPSETPYCIGGTCKWVPAQACLHTQCHRRLERPVPDPKPCFHIRIT
jgi:hypothetical protein